MHLTNCNACIFLEKVLLSNPIYGNSDQYFLSIEEAYEMALKREIEFLKRRKELGFEQHHPLVEQKSSQ